LNNQINIVFKILDKITDRVGPWELFIWYSWIKTYWTF